MRALLMTAAAVRAAERARGAASDRAAFPNRPPRADGAAKVKLHPPRLEDHVTRPAGDTTVT